MRTGHTIAYVVFGVLLTWCALCVAVAWPVFQWRNPKCNSMGFYRDFCSVVTFQKLEKYQ